MASDIIRHIAEQVLDVAALDPAIKVAAGAVTGEIVKYIGPERIENLKHVVRKAGEKLASRKSKPELPPLSVSMPLMEAARDESREELVDLWAALLAAASDPMLRGAYRADYIRVVKAMEPIDAAVLKLLETHSNMSPNRRNFISNQLKISEDQAEIAMDALIRIGLCNSMQGGNQQQWPMLSPMGREFLRLVRG